MATSRAETGRGNGREARASPDFASCFGSSGFLGGDLGNSAIRFSFSDRFEFDTAG
jgi:hypothetical protein